ncbi:MAG: GreA/GreB family elongation factor [Vitreimonas sp.]
MSRAFVKETDAPEEVPERLISSAPNYVTEEGLAAIDAMIGELARALDGLDREDDKRARLMRDLRYWSARRGSAQVKTPRGPDAVDFGARVTLQRNGSEERFRIVGEDEADPKAGTIAYVSPFARALLGKAIGDIVEFNGAEVEIVESA